jgi:polyribonucleotide nucleotidyltransferase
VTGLELAHPGKSKMQQKVTAQIGANQISIETGKIARLADGAVVVTCGDTMVLASAVSAPIIKEGQDYFPLTVDYREKAAAVGKFPGGYFKREGRPTEKETLTSRMIDRPLRPLFPQGYFYDTQIISILLSADGENDPDILAMNGASAALCISDVPFAGPIGAVRVGRVKGEFVANPTHAERAESDLDLVYVGTENDVIMIEGSANELPETEFVKALEFAHEHAREMIRIQRELAAQVGKPKREVPLLQLNEDLLDIAYRIAGDRIENALYTEGKIARSKAVDALREEVKTAILEKHPEADPFAISQAFDYVQKKAFRVSILEKQKRVDGRGYGDLRPISCEVSVLPRAHGAAIFQRGETQAVALATLAPIEEAQMIDAYGGGEQSKRFILHYNFPPFSVGETGRTGGPGRREIGHGALAERSLEPVVPSEQDFRYAIRISSEIMESNGSTSMASVCAGTLALMDAGVPIKTPVGGISIGLVTERGDNQEIKRYELLTDIIGSEDHFGDMDFKLCGTDAGVTGFQLDLKLPGISHKSLRSCGAHSISLGRSCPNTRPESRRLRLIRRRLARSSAPAGRPSRVSSRRPALRLTLKMTARCTSMRPAVKAWRARRKSSVVWRAKLRSARPIRGASSQRKSSARLWKSSRAKMDWCTFLSLQISG